MAWTQQKAPKCEKLYEVVSTKMYKPVPLSGTYSYNYSPNLVHFGTYLCIYALNANQFAQIAILISVVGFCCSVSGVNIFGLQPHAFPFA